MKTIVDTFQAKPYGWDLASIEVDRRLADRRLEGHADGGRQRPQAQRGRRRAAQHAEARARGRRAAEDVRRAQGRHLPQVLHRLLRRGQRAEGPAGAGPPRRGQAQGQARRAQGHRQPARSTRSSSSSTAPIGLLEQVVGKPDDWYLNDFNLGDDLLEAKENLIDPIQSFLNGPAAVDLRRGRSAADHPQQQPQLPARRAATRPSRPRSRTRTPSAATRWPSSSRPPTTCASQIDERRRRRTARRSPHAIEGRKAELARQRLLREGHAGGPAARRPADRPDARASRRREPGRAHPADRIELRVQRLPGAARPARRVAGRAGAAIPRRRSRPSRSRPSRCPARPVSSKPRQTSTTTSPPCVARSSRP